MRSAVWIRMRPLALAFIVLGSTACAAAVSTVEVESAQIAARVITALVNDPDIGSRSIDVRVTRGVVHLSGRVRSDAERTRAIEIARAVPGVARVDSSLTIGADVPDVPEATAPTSGSAAGRDVAAEFAELAEPRARVAVGMSLGWSDPSLAAAESGWSAAPLVRLGTGAGFGPTIGFDWQKITLPPADPSMPVSRLRMRPIMAGLAYTLHAGPVSVSPFLVGGYSFNRVTVSDTGTAGRLAIDARNSLAWRPGISVWIDSGRQTSVNVSAGRLMTRPRVSFIEDGVIDRRSLRADSTVVSVGVAYTLF
jgi:hypothetical protein